MSATQAGSVSNNKNVEGSAGSSASKPASPSDGQADEAKATTTPKPKTPAKMIMHGVRIFDAIAVMFALNIIVIARFFRPGFWSTLMYTALGLPVGVAMSFLYFQRKKEKRTRRQLVCFTCTHQDFKQASSFATHTSSGISLHNMLALLDPGVRHNGRENNAVQC